MALWTLGYAFELSSITLATTIFWGKVQYIGIAIVPVAWLLFALRYTQRVPANAHTIVLLLGIIPTITIVLIWTNEFHHLIWRTTTIEPRNAGSLLNVTYGLWFWIHTLFSYMCLGSGSVLLARSLLRSPQLYRRQVFALLVAVSAPWVGNILYITGWHPWPGLDLTPFGIIISAFFLVWNLTSFRLLDLVPIARDMLIERMSDGVIVLDFQHRVVDLNGAARHALNVSSRIIGQPAEEVFAAWPDLIARYQNITEVAEEISIGAPDTQQVFDVRITALRDHRARLTGRLIVWRDVTERKRVEEALRASEEKLRILFDLLPVGVAVVDNQGSIVEMNPALSKIIGMSAEDAQRGAHAHYTYISADGQPLPVEAFPSMRATSYQQSSQDVEIGIVKGSDEPIWVNVSAAPMPIEGLGALVVTSDITERKTREDRLHRLNTRLLLHVQETPLGYIEWDRNVQVVSWNPAAERIFGYRADEVLGRSVAKLIVPEYLWTYTERLDKELLSQSGGQRSTNPNITKDGREIICDWYNTTLTDRDGTVTGWASLIEDITDRVRIEAALRQNEARYRMLARHLPNVSVFLFDHDLRYLLVEGATLERYGYTQAQIEGRTLHEALSKHAVLLEPYYRAALCGETRTLEYSYEQRILFSQFVPIADDKGSIVAGMAVAEDITDRARQAAAIWEANHKLQLRVDELSTLNSITQTVVMHQDINAMVKTVAQQVATLLNASGAFVFLLNEERTTLTETADYRSRQPEDTSRFVIPIQNMHIVSSFLSSKRPAIFVQPQVDEIIEQCGFPRPDEPFTSLLVVPLIVVGEVIGFIVVTSSTMQGVLTQADAHLAETVAGQLAGVIAHARLLLVAENARSAAETANRAKSQFLAVMSHELRTPLNGILGYTQLLQREPLSGAQQEMLHIIDQSGHHLLTLLNDILDLAKIEAGSIELVEEPCDLPAFLSEIGSMALLWAKRKMLTFRFDKAPANSVFTLPTHVLCDRRRLRQVLFNLLGNAIKFTDSGTVTLSVRAEAIEGQQRSLVRFRIEDTGVGISPEEMLTIFEPFRQAGDRSRRSEGTGLGLAVCTELLRLMGSELHVQSALGQGSSFWFELELKHDLVMLELSQYNTVSIETVAQLENVVLPPAESIAELLNLALLGDVRAIQQRAAALVTKNEEWEPFAKEIQRLAEAFQIDAIRTFLQTSQMESERKISDAEHNYHIDR